MPSQTKENYLKAIYHLSEKNKQVSISDIAKVMGVSKPTINNMVKKMQEQSWVHYQKYKPIELTAKGKKMAALIIRKHRLTEMFLTQVMHFGWEEVHDIAEEIEHLKSDVFFNRMDEILGFPKIDPHGSPIPDKQGNLIKLNAIKLSKTNVGDKVVLSGLTESSKELLLYLNKKNMQLGSVFTVQHIENFDKSYEVILENSNEKIILSPTVCKSLLVNVIS